MFRRRIRAGIYINHWGFKLAISVAFCSQMGVESNWVAMAIVVLSIVHSYISTFSAIPIVHLSSCTVGFFLFYADASEFSASPINL